MLRWASGLERVWVAASRLTPPFVFACVVEGRGQIDVSAVTRAARRAAAACPGVCARLAGGLGLTRWVPGPPPPVHVCDGPWDGGPASFLERSFDLWTGPTVEIWCAPGDPARLVVRAAHAVTDGRGLSLFVRALVQALNGVDPEPVPGGPVTDAALARAAPIVEGVPAVPVAAPTGAPSGDAAGAVWSRVSIPGRGADRPLARLLVALARARPGSPVHVDVPVDLRRFGGGPSTANLSGWLRVDATALLDDADPIGAAAALVRARADTGEAFAPARLAHKLRWVPLALMVREGRRRSALERAAGAWPVSATASWLGRTPTAERSWPGFTAERTWWVPPGSAGLPLLTIMSGTEHTLDLTASAPAPLATGGRLDALLRELAHALAGPS